MFEVEQPGDGCEHLAVSADREAAAAVTAGAHPPGLYAGGGAFGGSANALNKRKTHPDVGDLVHPRRRPGRVIYEKMMIDVIPESVPPIPSVLSLRTWMQMTTPEAEPTAQATSPKVNPSAPPGGGVNPPTAAQTATDRSPWGRAVALLRHPGWSWTVGRDWLIPSAVAMATLFLGAALGGLPALVASSWQDPQTRIAVWTAIALGIVGLVSLLATWLMWRGRKRILRRNGTAYVIQEAARGWSADDSRAFLASAKRQFARMIEVPGPGKLSGSWDWPLSEGAQDWDSKVTELVRAFQALRCDDDPVTPKGLFMWAWAPVAIAFGARATAADRGLVLDVWQRPSRGRAGHVEMAPWSQRPHRLGSGQQLQTITEVLPDSIPHEYRWPVQVIIKSPEATAGAVPKKSHSDGEMPVILLVRLGSQSWGPVPDVSAGADPVSPLTLVLEDAGGLSRGGTFRTEIRELRIMPPAGSMLFPWTAYPALVGEAAAWIRRQTAEAKERPTMIGTILPPEVALGLGIAAAQNTAPAWPNYLWPIVPKPVSTEFVVPRLNLGVAALSRPIISALAAERQSLDRHNCLLWPR